MPANYMAGAYFEFLHLNETISWQLGVSAEYEYVDEYGENNSMAAYEVKNRVRLGGELVSFPYLTIKAISLCVPGRNSTHCSTAKRSWILATDLASIMEKPLSMLHLFKQSTR